MICPKRISCVGSDRQIIGNINRGELPGYALIGLFLITTPNVAKPVQLLLVVAKHWNVPTVDNTLLLDNLV
jgi:hypothetical protein